MVLSKRQYKLGVGEGRFFTGRGRRTRRRSGKLEAELFAQKFRDGRKIVAGGGSGGSGEPDEIEEHFGVQIVALQRLLDDCVGDLGRGVDDFLAGERGGLELGE